MNVLTAADLAALLFPLLNGLRVLAYLPQIMKIARDRHGAEAISCTTWLLFALSHLSTVLYAALIVCDRWMAWIFVANLIACITVLSLTAFKRSL